MMKIIRLKTFLNPNNYFLHINYVRDMDADDIPTLVQELVFYLSPPLNELF